MKGLHYFDLEQKKRRKHPGPSASGDHRIESKLFTKYFPKYHKEFVMSNKSGAIQSKIKGAKFIKNFQISPLLKSRPDWRTLLGNKMKNTKTLTNIKESARIFAEKIKLFSGLQSVQITMNFVKANPFHGFQSQNKQLELSFSKACNKLGRLRHLKYLEASPLTSGSKKCFTRLKAQKRLLDSLKSLKTYFDWTDASDTEISEMIEKNKNLLRNVTYLKLASLSSPFHFESFQRLGELCSKIAKLEFEFGSREATTQLFEVKTNYLQTLGAFHNLRTLNLGINDVFTFLKDFVLPPSIQSLQLRFGECLSKKIMLRIDTNFVDSSEEELSRMFEGDNLLLRFYDSFKGLDQLESLDLFFVWDSNTETYKYQNSLFQSLLKRISSPLKNLAITPSIPFMRVNQTPEVVDPSLPQFIESCENFAPTLETLKIGCSKAIYPKFDLSTCWDKFTNLSDVSIKGSFTQSQDNIGPFLQNFISLGDSVTMISLEGSIGRDAEALLSVLKQLNELKRPNKLKIQLFLSLQDFQPKEKPLSFADGIKKLQSDEKCYSKMEGVFLKYTGHSAYQPFMTLYQERFDK